MNKSPLRSIALPLAALFAVFMLLACPVYAQDAEPEKTPAAEPEKKPAAEPEKTPDAEPEKKPAADAEKKPNAEPEKKPAADAEKPNAEATAGKTPDVTVETVLEGLDNPCGIAVQPETGHIFVSDSAGLRIVKFDPAKPGEMTDVITGFPESTYGKGPIYKIGPLGLAFLNKNTLVVGGGGKPDGEEILRVYTLPEDGSAITADKMSSSGGPLPKNDDEDFGTTTGEGNFYGLAVSHEGDAVYVSSNGDDTKGWVLKADIKNGKAVNLRPLIATKIATEVDAPVAMTMHHSQNYVVVGQMGEINKPGDSLLTMYSPTNGTDHKGKLKLNLETGLFDISALAYCPCKEGAKHLYAADFAWMDPAQGGVYRLDATFDMASGAQGVNSVLVTHLDKPTAMAFGADGALYVTVFGAAEEGSDKKPGKVVKITFKGKY